MARQSYFAFKQFIVNQEKCAMKVCTDSCLFGAWLAEQLKLMRITIRHALDIGAGTGLLSLMLAQETDGNVTGIDIDPAAVEQARENVSASPFNERIEIVESRLQNFESSQPFDLVFSNPPFFEGQLTSTDTRRNNAMHGTSLSIDELLNNMDRLMVGDGWFALLMPAYREQDVKAMLLDRGFFIHREALVCQTEKHEPFRMMWLFSRKKPYFLHSECIPIKIEQAYSSRFNGLLQRYYLHL
jgi:tRNA1Val (adenine37-N6)-methyltransferase